MTALEVFTYSDQPVRTVLIDGEPWFVAGDVATVLGYSATSDMTRSLDDDEKGMHQTLTLGGPQVVSIVTESGLYKAIVQRQTGRMVDAERKEYVRKFQRWVTHEVLPAIRKTGTYSTTPALPQSYASALRELAASVEQAAELEAKVTELTPSAEAWDELAAATGDYSVGESSKILARAGVETGPTRLFNQLADINWIFRDGHHVWTAYASAVDNGYVTLKPSSHPHPRTGERIVDPPQVRITVKGLDRLRVRLGALVLT